MKGLEALKRIKSHYNDRVYIDILEDFDLIETALKRLEQLEEEKQSFDIELEKKLKALDIIKESIGIKMSVDEDLGCLYVPITKCFQPLEQNIVIVGYVKGKEKIDLLKEVLVCD